MIRATLILSAAVYLTLVIGGQDDGQKRIGLMQAEANTPAFSYRYTPREPQPEPRVRTVSTLPTAFVTASTLNVRFGPSTDRHAVGKLSQGEEVSVLRRAAGWTQIRIEGDGVEGWVSSDYLTDAPLRMAAN
ncbi:SH3 domain-containing protein [Falsirhodobacter deserti]|uniref:SH3 domain-containing protein n=1 Tax=Falsirhodobacter deserti TaxID=1365611 RepID=UPI000FE398F9|nr:SH3 domain-containing protein [Falsirhodobacter deserti]